MPILPKVLNIKYKFQYMSHIRKFHSCDPNFFITCGVDGCPRTLKKFSTFRVHVSFYHGGRGSSLQPATVQEDYCLPEENDILDNFNCGNNCENQIHLASYSFIMFVDESAREQHEDDVIGRLKKASAMFILGTKEKFKLTQAAIQGIINGVSNLIQVLFYAIVSYYGCDTISPQEYLAALQVEVRRQLNGSGISAESMNCLDDLFNESSPFMHPFSLVQSAHLQLKFYRDHFNIVVSLWHKSHHVR